MADEWVSPTAFEDPGSDWEFETRIYDGDVDTAAYTYGLGWSLFVELIVSSITSNNVRIYCSMGAYSPGNTDAEIDIDVELDGSWTHVFAGTVTHSTWVEKSFTQGTVTKARIRGNTPYGTWLFSIHEFEFWKIELPPSAGGGSAAAAKLIGAGVLTSIAFIGLNIADAYLTKLGLAMGAVELNPLARIFGSSMLWKGLIAGVIVAGLYYWHKEKLLLPVCLGMLGVCLWNLVAIGT